MFAATVFINLTGRTFLAIKSTLPLVMKRRSSSKLDNVCCAVSMQQCHTKNFEVSIIVPVHNASETIRETIASAMNQVWLLDEDEDAVKECSDGLPSSSSSPPVTIYVCCYNDASTDDSAGILNELCRYYAKDDTARVKNKNGCDKDKKSIPIPSQLLVSTAPPNTPSRGAGYARNRAVAMRANTNENDDSPTTSHHCSTASTDKPNNNILCWLDSDDIMHPTRIYHQARALLKQQSRNTLLGCTFDRIPSNATQHYTQWANGLSSERLVLERYREVTLIQPTWMMYRERFTQLGGYLEAPMPVSGKDGDANDNALDVLSTYPTSRLVHSADTPRTLRVAEDLRLFHEHLEQGGRLKQCRVNPPLVTYRHRAGQSQCSQTPRKLLLQLRAAAFERTVLKQCCTDDNGGASNGTLWKSFIVWGAGRDGKDFCKALSKAARERVYCMVDVDEKKIAHGFYQYGRQSSDKHKEGGWKIPIVHFSLAANDPQLRDQLYAAWKSEHASSGASQVFGRIDKSVPTKKPTNDAKHHDRDLPPVKKLKVSFGEKKDPGTEAIDLKLLPGIPIVVCVAMNRTNGALEANVKSVGRTEGIDLWHFS